MSSQDICPEWPADKVRSTFIEFFCSKMHVNHLSSSVVPHDDPTLLFANAGMNQFKPIFLGTVDPNSDMSKLKRATNSQKCIRAGGKHNDLDDVGKDVYHHTFFEMLGNWSFGDYFKKDAISFAWELLTKVYRLSEDRLYVTYFGGDSSQNLPEDIEAKQLWIDIGVPESRILPFGTKDNFWEMGEVGPCGPCSEIHYDRIGNRDAAHLVNLDDPDVLEIWNLVFMQYNRESQTELKPLPNSHIDTGMGFERLVSVLQNKSSNYDTDVFVPIFKAIQEKSGVREYTGKVGPEDVDGIDMAYRVIADHVRTLLFAITDGAVPSNEGRGYVVRRILRRGARYARKKMQVELGNFFPSLLDVVVQQMSPTFPEILKKVDFIKQTLQSEEISFARTLDRGEKLFDATLNKMRTSGQTTVPGAEVWKLYDTFGFPVDLTRVMADENSVFIDEAEFEAEKNKSKELSKKKKGNDSSSETVLLDVHTISHLETSLKIQKTDDSFKFSKSDITSSILSIYSNKGFVQTQEASSDGSANTGQLFGILLDKTNFYAEAGGQEWDTGYLLSQTQDSQFVVTQVKNFGGYVLHVGYLKNGSLSIGESVLCCYDQDRRRSLCSNHTSTHILNHSLRNVLVSDELDQRGSLVASDKLRFDFSFNGQISADQIKEIELKCKKVIDDDLEVFSSDVPLQNSKEINGLRAVFGETYPNPVRVVSIGKSVDELVNDPHNESWVNYSIELCGGTHVKSTKEISDFIITEEASISKGIRRIVAVTGPESEQVLNSYNIAKQMVDKLSTLSGSQLESEIKVVGKFLDNVNAGVYNKHVLRTKFNQIRSDFIEADKAAKALATKFAIDQVNIAIESNPDAKYHVINLQFDNSLISNSGKALSNAIAHVKSLNSKAVYLISPDATLGKVAHLCYVPKDLINSGLHAKQWAESVSSVIGGKCGGKNESAQGSGTNVQSVSDAERVANDFAKLNIK
ncbi:Alanine-tRNA ligase [Smittium culicis]|uniref:Alanine--tRNA ligase n=1 Tax=Smittium culicis TaxID=133412 RepID=A0A1R1Y960_9FUNG|nr:Alanine-tRNA ligase [Smittium culicis]